jgi:hypothetical protein
MRPVFSRKLAALLVFGCLTAAAPAQMYPSPMGYPQPYGGYPYGGYPSAGYAPAYNPYYYSYPRNPFYGYAPQAAPVNYYYQTMSPMTTATPTVITTPKPAPTLIAPVPAAPMLPAPVIPPAATIKTEPPVIITPAPTETSTPLATPRVAQPLPSSPAVPKFDIKDSSPVSPNFSLPDPTNCTTPGACTECIKQECCNNCCCPRVWASAEYLMWWFKSAPEPFPFLQSIPFNAVNTAQVTNLLGGTDIDTGTRSGGRFAFGGWLDSCNTFGLEGSYFFVTPKDSVQSAGIANTLPTTPFLAIPIVTPGNIPGTTVGTVLVENAPLGSSATNTLTLRDDLFGFEANGILNLTRKPNLKLDLIGGFRYLQFDESLSFAGSFNGALGGTFPGMGVFAIATPAISQVAATFADQNRFYGGNLGARGEIRFGNFFVNGTGKVALGEMQENLTQTVVSNVSLGTTPPVPAGMSVQQSTVNHFAVVPEANLNVGWQFARWGRAYVGYDFLYVSDVLRPGQQVNPAGFLSNAPVENHTTFWAHGANFGLEFRF